MWTYGSVYMEVRIFHSRFVVPFYLLLYVTIVTIVFLFHVSIET